MAEWRQKSLWATRNGSGEVGALLVVVVARASLAMLAGGCTSGAVAMPSALLVVHLLGSTSPMDSVAAAP